MIEDAAAFVRDNTAVERPPLVPEVALHLASEVVPLWQATEADLAETGLPPPFWAFAWAGGQALARFLLDEPDWVAGKRVLDFAAGSGVQGIAAALAGAARVEASEIDRFALAALALNAEANGVALELRDADVIDLPNPGWEVVLAGDVCYERPMAARVGRWLGGLAREGATVLMGDPGRTYLPKHALNACAVYHVPVTRAREDQEIKRTRVWQFR